MWLDEERERTILLPSACPSLMGSRSAAWSGTKPWMLWPAYCMSLPFLLPRLVEIYSCIYVFLVHRNTHTIAVTSTWFFLLFSAFLFLDIRYCIFTVGSHTSHVCCLVCKNEETFAEFLIVSLLISKSTVTFWWHFPTVPGNCNVIVIADAGRCNAITKQGLEQGWDPWITCLFYLEHTIYGRSLSCNICTFFCASEICLRWMK
jgi:hypothetical protein